MLQGFHAAAAAVACSRVQRNSVPSTHMRCMITANRRARATIAFSNRPFRVKRFQTIHHYGVDVAHGLVLLFGIGTRGPSLIGHSGSSAFRLSTTTVSMSLTGSCFSSESAPGALPSWDSRTRWNNLSGGLAVRRTVGPSGHANSPHPSSREGHHSTARWSSSVLLLD